jgi:hypothetical protein
MKYKIIRHHRRKRVIQYSETSEFSLDAAAYWMPACAGMTASHKP